MNQEQHIKEISQQLKEYGFLVKQLAYSYTDLLNAVSYYVNDLISHDFSKLIQLLYQLDINEEQLKSLLEHTPTDLTSNAIAELVIQRQQNKLQLRKSFTKDTDIPEDERW